MTLIVGVKCSDGIVIGADTAATLGALGQQTAVQTAFSKVHVVENQVLCAFSGHVGLGQFYRAELEDMVGRDQLGKGNTANSPESIRKAITTRMWPHVEERLKRAVMMGTVMKGSHLTEVMCLSLIAFAVGDEAHLVQFSEQCNSEESTPDLPFCCVGSGEPIADPFMGFLRHVFWKDHQPTVFDGGFAVYWTIKHVCRVNTGGIGEPITMATLTQDKGEFVARQMTRDELREVDQAIATAEDHLRTFPRVPVGTTEDSLPMPQH